MRQAKNSMRNHNECGEYDFVAAVLGDVAFFPFKFAVLAFKGAFNKFSKSLGRITEMDLFILTNAAPMERMPHRLAK